MAMTRDPEELAEVITESRERGALEALMEPNAKYLLIAYQVYPTGSTSEDMVQDPEVAKAIGAKTGLGDPTDPQGWGIWEVGEVSV